MSTCKWPAVHERKINISRLVLRLTKQAVKGKGEENDERIMLSECGGGGSLRSLNMTLKQRFEYLMSSCSTVYNYFRLFMYSIK